MKDKTSKEQHTPRRKVTGGTKPLWLISNLEEHVCPDCCDAFSIKYVDSFFDAVKLLGNSFGYFEIVQDDLKVRTKNK